MALSFFLVSDCRKIVTFFVTSVAVVAIGHEFIETTLPLCYNTNMLALKWSKGVDDEWP